MADQQSEMNSDTQAGFEELISQLEIRISKTTANSLVDEICTNPPDWRKPHEYVAVDDHISAITGEIETEQGIAEALRFKRLVIARLASTLPGRLPVLGLPESITSRIAPALQRLLGYIKDEDIYRDHDDYFMKDLLFATGCMVPAAATSLELRGGITRGTLIKGIVKPKTLMRCAGLLATGSTSPWFRVHVETRYLDEFGEEGLNEMYMLCAEMLTMHDSVLGMVGTTWFLDPQLLEVSPRLGYVQKTWIDGGAIPIRNGPSDSATRFATAQSETRRRLYDEGKYVPIDYTYLWPREALIAWANSRKQSVAKTSDAGQAGNE